LRCHFTQTYHNSEEKTNATLMMAFCYSPKYNSLQSLKKVYRKLFPESICNLKRANYYKTQRLSVDK